MASIHNVKTGDTITQGLAGCTRSDEAIVAARRIAAERGEDVWLSDDDGEWLVRPDGRCDYQGEAVWLSDDGIVLDGECAICAAHGVTTRLDTSTATEIPHDPSRDGARVRTVYACPACAAACCRKAVDLSEDEKDAILILSAEARAAGHDAQVAICQRALRGDLTARAECARVIDAARAMED